jgi:hypothetical protein
MTGTDERELDTDTCTRFVYLVEGEPYLGTIFELAHVLEEAHYSGIDVGPDVYVFAEGRPVAHTYRTHSTGYNADDYATVFVELELEHDDPEEASYRLDGRA